MKLTIGQIVLAGSMAALAGCSYVADQDLDTGYAAIRNESGEEAGRAVLKKTASGVQVDLTVSGLEPGSYGVQIHGEGNCAGPGFASAGAPIAGAVHREAAVRDDYLAEFEVSGTGSGTASFTAAGLTLLSGPNSLFAPGGTALLIEKLNADQTYGTPVACGEISRTDDGAVTTSLPPGRLKSAEQAGKLGTGADKTFRQPQ